MFDTESGGRVIKLPVFSPSPLRHHIVTIRYIQKHLGQADAGPFDGAFQAFGFDGVIRAHLRGGGMGVGGDQVDDGAAVLVGPHDR